MPTKPSGVPDDVAAIRKKIREALNTPMSNGRAVGSSTYGIYAFYDYDAEPIYVGQTYEGLRARIGRHLTNQRTDAVAMNVLDPFEVAEIEMWPLNFQPSIDKAQRLAALDDAEYAVFQLAIQQSKFNAVLNEKNITKRAAYKLPASFRIGIIPENLISTRKHPDTRIARRASTIAALARVISERDVSIGLRRTLVTQAKRLEWLASRRSEELLQQPASVDDE